MQIRGGFNSQKGFSLIEIMLALVVSSIVLVAGVQLLVLGTSANKRTEALLSANTIAFAKIQEYENKTFDQIPIGDVANSYEVEDFSAQLVADSNGEIKSGTAKVYSRYNTGSLSLIKLNVVVDFQYGGRERQIEYGTYIQLGGVGR